MQMLKKTPLYDTYEKYGGKIGQFAGWALPLQFEGILAEYEAVRNKAGLFDLSHMGKIEIKGKDAFDFVQSLVTNDVKHLKVNGAVHTLMCYPFGAVLETLLLYKLTESKFLFVINSGNIEKTFKWLINKKRNQDLSIINVSNSISEIAIQGPKSQKILQRLTEFSLSNIEYLTSRRDVIIAGVKCFVSRTGYTCEDGFEIYTTPENIELLWNNILREGKTDGIKPVGVGARNTLRLEANLPPYGEELLEDITPFEAGLDAFVKLQKDSFIGKSALVKQNKAGIKRKIIGFEINSNVNAPSCGSAVMINGEKIGIVTAGMFSPKKNKNMGLALVDIEHSLQGTEIYIRNPNDLVEARVIRINSNKRNNKIII